MFSATYKRIRNQSGQRSLVQAPMVICVSHSEQNQYLPLPLMLLAMLACICVPSVASGQMLAPVETTQIQYADDTANHEFFQPPPSVVLSFQLHEGLFERDLLTAAEFRQYESRIENAIVYDDAVRQTAWAEPASLRPQQTEPSSAPADGFVATEQPMVEAFPAAAQWAESAQKDVPILAEQPLDAPASETAQPQGPTPPLEALTVPPSVQHSIGPSLPEGANFEGPISEQEIGQLNERIQLQLGIAENEPEDDKKRHLSLLQSARKSLDNANKYMWNDIHQINKARNFEVDRERLHTQLEQIRETKTPQANMEAADLFAEVDYLRAELAEHNDRLLEISKAENQRKQRIEKIPEERTKSKSELADKKRQMEQLENGEHDNYALILLRAQQLELTYRIKSLSSESKLHELENRLLPMHGDFLAREIKVLESEIDIWNNAANEQRRMDIAAEVREARMRAIDAAPALKSLANTTARLAERRADIAEKIRLATDEDLAVQAELTLVKNQHEQVNKSVVGNGLNEANGILMVEIRRKLPRPFKSYARINEIKRELRQLNLEQLELNEERKPLSHPLEYVESKLVDITSPTLSQEELRETAMEFVEKTRVQYDQLSSDHHSYTALLGQIAAERNDLVSEIRSTLEFVDEKSLWMQSAKSMGLDHLEKSQAGVREFFSPVQWFGLMESLTSRVKTSPHESAVGLIGLVSLFIFSRRFKG